MMKYISLKNITEAFVNNATTTYSKFWGVLGILSSIKKEIVPGESYTFSTGATSQFLEDLFGLADSKVYTATKGQYHVMFSTVWVEKIKQLMCASTPSFKDVAIWYFRNHAFNDDVVANFTAQSIRNLFTKETGITPTQLGLIFKDVMEEWDIDFTDSKAKNDDLLAILSEKYGNPKHYTSITAEGCFIKANPGELSRAPFIQTIYASQQSSECLLLTQFTFPKLYNQVIGSEEAPIDVKSPIEVNEPLQLIYYGAPGTGKSYTIDKVTNEANSVRTTFHPDSDYAGFVGAYKPTMENVPMTATYQTKEGTFGEYLTKTAAHPGTERKIVYKYVPQAFLKAYVEAWKRYGDGEPYYLVIEEINRGNCAQIFGDLFQLLDRNNTGSSSYAITADEDIRQFLAEDDKGFKSLKDPHAEDAIRNYVLQKDSGAKELIGPSILDGIKLLLPPNLRIWATMNTSDQSLFPIDSAFKRRWNWEYMPIDYDPVNAEGEPLDWKIEIGDDLYSWGEFLEKLNPAILELTQSEDKQMGYFFAKPDKENGVISEKLFLNKVLFYLWTDVLKDYDLTMKPFIHEETDSNSHRVNRPYRFTDFFSAKGKEYLKSFVAGMELHPEKNVEEPDGTSESTVE